MKWLLVLVAACVDQGPGPQGKKIDPAYVAAHLVKAAPADIARLDVTLGGVVRYLGNKLDKPSVAPGGTVRVTHYWQVLAPIEPRWRVFALVRGAPNTADFMNLPATDMELWHGPKLWKPGEIVEDVQDITLRPDWKSPTATLLVGLIETGEHGIGDRMFAVGPHVQDRAIIARVLEVDLSKAPPPPGTVYIPRATTPITIDGVASEQAWLTAATSPEFATGEGSPEPIGKAIAKMTWDDQNLYVFVSVTDTDIVTEYKKHDDSLWKADCVEMFIDADGNRRGYVELQVNPNNATFDSWFAGTRAQPGDPSWNSQMQTAVKVRGTTEPGDTDQGWDVEIAIPWETVKGRDAAMNVQLPPQVGDRWRMNVVRVDARTGDKNVAVSSWNRITYSDFHALDRMLTVVFADASGSIVRGAPGSATVGPATGMAIPMIGAGSAAGSGAASGSSIGSASSITNAPGTSSTPGPTTPRAGSGASTTAPAAGSGSSAPPRAGSSTTGAGASTTKTPGPSTTTTPGAGSSTTKAPGPATTPSAGSSKTGAGSSTTKAPGASTTTPGTGSSTTTAPRTGSGVGSAGVIDPARRAPPGAGSAAPPLRTPIQTPPAGSASH